MKITLITMSQGNPIALKRTIESFLPIVDEIIFGDVLIFEEDRKVIESYKELFPIKIIKFPFNYIFKEGFSSILNSLAGYSKNDFVLYMNVSEIIDLAWIEAIGTKAFLVDSTGAFNTYYFGHATEHHHWFRLYNYWELEWTGIIHEEVRPRNLPGKELKQAPFMSFQMADTEKDMDSPLRAKVYNDVKELVYFFNYMKLVDRPELIGVTHPGWVEYAKDGYQSLKERIEKKGNRYKAFLEGDLQMYLDDIFNNPEFEAERFESSELINYQGNRKLL